MTCTGSCGRFLKTVRPACGIVMETEVWPNLMQAANSNGIPMLLANARLSARSAKGYVRLGRLAQNAFSGFRIIAAQNDADAARLRALRNTQDDRAVRVTGNMKYDVEIVAAMQVRGAAFRELASNRRVMLAASTREGEEALLLEAFRSDMPPQMCCWCWCHAIHSALTRSPRWFSVPGCACNDAAMT